MERDEQKAQDCGRIQENFGGGRCRRSVRRTKAKAKAKAAVPITRGEGPLPSGRESVEGNQKEIEVLFTRLVHEYPDLQCRRKQARGVLRGACRGRHGRNPYQELLPYFPHGTTDIQPGSKTAVYCKKYAEDGMVNVRYKRCSHDSCARVPSFNVEGGKKAPYAGRMPRTAW